MGATGIPISEIATESRRFMPVFSRVFSRLGFVPGRLRVWWGWLFMPVCLRVFSRLLVGGGVPGR